MTLSEFSGRALNGFFRGFREGQPNLGLMLVTGVSFSFMMTYAIKFYVGLMATASVAVGLVVYTRDPSLSPAHVQAAVSFAALGLMTQLLSYRASAESKASMAFLPILAVVVLVPSWVALVAIGSAIAIAEIVSRRAPIKAMYNVAQTVLAAGVCVLVYRSLGGVSLLESTSGVFAAAAVTFPLFILISTVSLYGVIAISTGQSFAHLLGDHSPKRILYDLLALPFVFVFVWFYREFGPAGAGLLAIPLLGVRELYKTNAQLKRTNTELLDLMVAAIEARDPYTSGHSRRVAANTRIIAEMLGLGRKEIERIYVAALLHDVGKIHEEFGPILSKPGKLSADEFAVMKTHSAKGADLVQRVTDLQDTVLPILHHHENWDGSGYPHGIAGERIPLWSRMIMFADTIDAMMSDRPYRDALSSAQVRAELVRLKGKQFDPYICEILLASPVYEQLFVNAPPRESVLAPVIARDADLSPSPITLSA